MMWRTRYVVLSVEALTASFCVAADFPYGVTDMSVRHESESVHVSSHTTPVEIPAVNGGMPLADSVATFYADAVDFDAADEVNWSAGTNAIGDVQAALSMRLDGDVCRWMGYVAGRWVELTGVTAEVGVWQVKVDVDYSLGVGRERVRYSVGKTDAELVPLSVEAQSWVEFGNIGTVTEEQKIEHVRFFGFGDAGFVRAQSGRRTVSGTVAVNTSFGKTYQDVELELEVRDPWNVDAVSVELKDLDGNTLGEQKTVLTSAGTAKVRFSGVVPCDTYTYAVTLVGVCRGADVSCMDVPKDVLVGVRTDWFSYGGGILTNAAPEGLTLGEQGLAATAVSPRGKIVPSNPAPKDTKIVTVESTLTVSGALQESMLSDLDASTAQGALTVVRFDEDDVRAWACRQTDGNWTRLSGCSAENGAYDVRIDHDYRKGKRAVSYSIRPMGSDDWTNLFDVNARTAFPLPSEAGVLTAASLLGGTVSRLVAICKSTPKVVSGLVLIVR